MTDGPTGSPEDFPEVDPRTDADATRPAAEDTVPGRHRRSEAGPRSSASGTACSASSGTGDTSGYGGLVRPVEMPGGTAAPVRRLVRRGRRRAGRPACDRAAARARARSRRSSSTAARSPSSSGARTCSRSRSCCATTRRCASSSAPGVSGVHYPDDDGRELHAVYHLLSMTHNRRIRLEVDLPRRRPAHPVGGRDRTRPTTGTSARPTTSSASSSTVTPL